METRLSIVTKKITQLDGVRSQKATVYQPDIITTMQNIPAVMTIRQYIMF